MSGPSAHYEVRRIEMEQRLYDAADRLPEASLDFQAIQPAPKKKPSHRILKAIASLAICLVILISIGFATVEAMEYNDAVVFFNENGLSTDGLSRGEIKAVYRDITTKSFTYAKTAEVIANSLSTEQVGGHALLQETPTPEDIEKVWNFMNHLGDLPTPTGVRYEKRYAYKEDMSLDKSYLEKYDGDTLLWSAYVSESWIYGYRVLSDGIIVYGNTPTWAAWMTKIDSDGKLLWTHTLSNGFDHEDIVEIFENPDGGYSVISHGNGEGNYFCFSRYTADGNEIYFQKTDVGHNGTMNAARLGDGYIVQLGQGLYDKDARIVKVDNEGNMTEAFSYDGGDAYYYITNMIEYNGNIYLSAYAVPKLADEEQNAGGRHEIAAVLNYLFDNNIWEISSEELTPLIRDNYTAMLLICDPASGTPQEFYSVEGSLGGGLSLNDSGMLLWNVESITTTSYLPTTNAYTFRGTSYVFRYSFDSAGELVSQEKTDEAVIYIR